MQEARKWGLFGLRVPPTSAIIAAMTNPTSNPLVDAAREFVAAAAAQNLRLRVLGGVAVLMTCPSIATHPSLQRPIKDLDLVARRADFEACAQVLTAEGAVLQSRAADEWVFRRNGVEIELTVPDFREDYRIDLTPRLALDSPALPAGDLLLVKLQRVKFAEKDIQDCIALLLDHAVAHGEEPGQINAGLIAQWCARNWGLFQTVYGNTVALEKVLDRYVPPTEAQSVWQRVEALQSAMDKEDKSLGWMVNQLLRRPHEIPT